MFLANHNVTAETDVTVIDPYWKEVVYYSRYDFSATSNEAGLLTPTVVGSAARSATQSKFGGYSLFKPGGASYLTLGAANNTSYNMGTGDFTIEYWLYFNANFPGSGNYAGLCLNAKTNGTAGSPEGMSLTIYQGGITTATRWRVGFYNGNFTGGIFGMHTQEMASGAWNHVAVCRSSGSILVFVNGSMQNVGTMTNSISTSNASYLGQDAYNEYGQAMYYDEVRVTKGIARYRASFPAPTKAYSTPTLV